MTYRITHIQVYMSNFVVHGQSFNWFVEIFALFKSKNWGEGKFFKICFPAIKINNFICGFPSVEHFSFHNAENFCTFYTSSSGAFLIKVINYYQYNLYDYV